MRILLGWLALMALAALAGWIQARWTDEVREERDAVLRGGVSPAVSSDRPEDWSRVVVGRPSGAEPVELPTFPAPDTRSEPWADAPPTDDLTGSGRDHGRGPRTDAPPPTASREGPVFEVRVEPGMVLSKLCAKAYGRGTPRVVDAVARYNGLANANRIAPGDVLRFPPWDDLRGSDGESLDTP